MFRHLVLARIIEPSSKLDSLRGPGRSRGALASYSTLRRRPPARAQEQWWRQRLPEACAALAGLSPASLAHCDVPTLLKTSAGPSAPSNTAAEARTSISQLRPLLRVRRL